MLVLCLVDRGGREEGVAVGSESHILTEPESLRLAALKTWDLENRTVFGSKI